MKMIRSILISLFGLLLLTSNQEITEEYYFETHPDIKYNTLKAGFYNVPQEAKMRVFWFWLNGLATKKSITQDLEAMKANGIAGAILVDNGANYSPPGAVFMSDEWEKNFGYAIKEADRLGIEISLNIQSGAGDPGNPNIKDDNGLKKTTWSEKKVTGPGKIEIELPIPPNQIYYKDITVQAIKTPHSDVQKDELIKNWSVKSFNKKESWDAKLDRFDMNQFYEHFGGDEKSLALTENEIIDLNENYKDSILTWNVPEGEWTIIRYGMTSTGKRNNYASAGYKGGLCYDQINRRGITAQWNDVAKPLIDIAKKNGNSLKFVHVDSWEMGIDNWTQNFESEFKKRRGYAIEPYLPVLTGKIVGSREISNRFLEDYRLTIGDLAVEDNYEIMRNLAHSEGISMHSESAGPHISPLDGLRALGVNDIPMGEFWARANTHRNTEGTRMCIKLGASAAHIYGKRFYAAEIPTSVGPIYERSPSDVKIVLDRAFCTGVNRINWHTYTSSPDEYGLPGIEYFAGTHLNRHVTWWKESKTFIDYINRTQHMLTQGLQVADVLGYLGSGVPLYGFLESDLGDIPPGYAWDMCNSDVILNRASIKDGRIYLPDGKNYAILALSDHKDISLPVLRKLEEMVSQGIILVGNPPERAYGLTDYPKSDKEVKAIVEKLWGQADGHNSRVNKFGKGKVYTGMTVAEVLEAENIKPDLAWEPNKNIDLEYIHYTSDDEDVYYVLNKWAWKGIDDLEYRNVATLPDRYVKTNCTFRVKGDRKIERWDPVTGEITSVEVYTQKEDGFTIPVNLEPEGASFFVFRKSKKVNNILTIKKDGQLLTEGNTPFSVGASSIFVIGNKLEVLNKGKYHLTFSDGKEITIDNPSDNKEIDLRGPWEVHFMEKPLLGKPFTETFNELQSWTASHKHAIKYFSGIASYKKNFTLRKENLNEGKAYLNLGKVGDIATVKLNGKEVGVYWKPPYIADITDFLNVGKNELTIEVTNLWINRLIGDEKLPPQERKTRTNLENNSLYDKLRGLDTDKYLRFSGLMGPVRIKFSKMYEINK